METSGETLGRGYRRSPSIATSTSSFSKYNILICRSQQSYLQFTRVRANINSNGFLVTLGGYHTSYKNYVIKNISQTIISCFICS